MKYVPVPLFLVLAAPLSAQYAGPAILSRGEAPAAMAAPQIDFRPFVEIGGTYEAGLAGIAVNSQGQPVGLDTWGGTLAWGVSGVHSWRHTKVGLDYRGALNYLQRNQYNSIAQGFMLGVTQQLTRHIALFLRETAGITTVDFGLVPLTQTVPFDPSTADVPVNDYFNTRTMYTTTQADLQIQKSARLSFDLGGDAFFIRYNSKALFGTNGLSARGDLQYRITRKSTIGALYTFMHYSYPGLFGGTDVHGAAGTYAIRISRQVEFSGYGGFMRIESLFVRTVPVDPVIAALLGITGAPEVVHRITYTPNVAGRLSRTYRTGVLYIFGGHTVIPGNGVFLTSLVTSVTGGYSYTGLRRWSFGASAMYARASSIGTITGDYRNTSEVLMVSRQIAHSLHFVLSYAARQYQSGTFANYDRQLSEARASIGYSPGDIPLRIW